MKHSNCQFPFEETLWKLSPTSWTERRRIRLTPLHMSFGLGEVWTLAICALGGAPLTPTIPRISLGRLDLKERRTSLLVTLKPHGVLPNLYVLIAEKDSGSVTKFKSRDTTFLESGFPKNARLIHRNLNMRCKVMLTWHLFIRVGDMISQIMNWFIIHQIHLPLRQMYQITLLIILLTVGALRSRF